MSWITNKASFEVCRVDARKSDVGKTEEESLFHFLYTVYGMFSVCILFILFYYDAEFLCGCRKVDGSTRGNVNCWSVKIFSCLFEKLNCSCCWVKNVFLSQKFVVSFYGFSSIDWWPFVHFLFWNIFIKNPFIFKWLSSVISDWTNWS